MSPDAPQRIASYPTPSRRPPTRAWLSVNLPPRPPTPHAYLTPPVWGPRPPAPLGAPGPALFCQHCPHLLPSVPFGSHPQPPALGRAPSSTPTLRAPPARLPPRPLAPPIGPSTRRPGTQTSPGLGSAPSRRNPAGAPGHVPPAPGPPPGVLRPPPRPQPRPPRLGNQARAPGPAPPCPLAAAAATVASIGLCAHPSRKQAPPPSCLFPRGVLKGAEAAARPGAGAGAGAGEGVSGMSSPISAALPTRTHRSRLSFILLI